MILAGSTTRVLMAMFASFRPRPCPLAEQKSGRNSSYVSASNTTINTRGVNQTLKKRRTPSNTSFQHLSHENLCSRQGEEEGETGLSHFAGRESGAEATPGYEWSVTDAGTNRASRGSQLPQPAPSFPSEAAKQHPAASAPHFISSRLNFPPFQAS